MHNGYQQSKHTPRLKKHDTRQIQFCLIIDDFGIRYIGRDNAEHLKQVLKQHYEITKNWGKQSMLAHHQLLVQNQTGPHPNAGIYC